MTGTERKVFQKYYPPDFDPSKIPRAKIERNRQFVQRVMIPYNMQCNTCGEYIYKGKKFNMRRETAEGEFYLGLKIFRFYVRCPNCLAELTFKTDLENTDYVPEHGHTRLFDAAKLHIQQRKAQAEKEEAEKADPMKMLEKRTKMSRAEMEALGMLEELKEESKKNGAISLDKMVEMVTEAKVKAAEKAVEEDEAVIDSIFGQRIKAEEGEETERAQRVLFKRLKDSDEEEEKAEEKEKEKEDEGEKPGTSASSVAVSGDFASGERLMPAFSAKPPSKRPKTASSSAASSLKAKMAGLVKVKSQTPAAGPAAPASTSSSASALPLIAGYGSSSSSDDE